MEIIDKERWEEYKGNNQIIMLAMAKQICLPSQAGRTKRYENVASDKKAQNKSDFYL